MRPVTLNLAVLIRDLVNDNPWPGVDEVIEFNDTTCPAVDDEVTKYLVEQVFVVMGYDSNQGDSILAPAGWQVFTLEEATALIPGWAADGLEFHAATKITCSNDPDNFYVVGDSFYDVLNAFNSCCGTPNIQSQALTFKISNTPLEPGEEYACGTAAAYRWLAIFGSENPGDGTYQMTATLYDAAQNPANTKVFDLTGGAIPFTATEQIQRAWPADFIGMEALDGTFLIANDAPLLDPFTQKRVLDYDNGIIVVTVGIFNNAAEQISASQTTAALPATQCGAGCISPYPDPLTLPDGVEGLAYNATTQLQGAGPFSMVLGTKPAWLNGSLNTSTGLITWSGTPDASGPASVELTAENCGQPATGEAIPIAFDVAELVVFPLNNFEDNLVPGLPFGMFEGDETFMGNATTMQQAADLWNNNPAFAAIATAYPIPGNESALGLVLITADPLPDVRALRYWFVTAVSATNALIYLSADTIVRLANGTQVRSEVAGTLGIYNDFGLNANTYGIAGDLPLVDITSPYYKVALSAGQNFVYHNEEGEWAWFHVFGNFSNNGGNLPPTVRFLACQSNPAFNDTNNLRLSNFTNKNTAIANVEALSYNGRNIQYVGADMALMPELKTWQMIQLSGPMIELADLNLSNAVTPNLTWIAYRRNNGGPLLAANPGFWTALPPLTQGIDMVGAQLEPSATVDDAFNGLAVSLASVTPVTGARLTLQSQNAARTSASDTAVTTLSGLGFSIG
jgi:hypothetical protein